MYKECIGFHNDRCIFRLSVTNFSTRNLVPINNFRDYRLFGGTSIIVGDSVRNSFDFPCSLFNIEDKSFYFQQYV